VSLSQKVLFRLVAVNTLFMVQQSDSEFLDSVSVLSQIFL